MIKKIKTFTVKTESEEKRIERRMKKEGFKLVHRSQSRLGIYLIYEPQGGIEND